MYRLLAAARKYLALLEPQGLRHKRRKGRLPANQPTIADADQVVFVLELFAIRVVEIVPVFVETPNNQVVL